MGLLSVFSYLLVLYHQCDEKEQCFLIAAADKKAAEGGNVVSGEGAPILMPLLPIQ
jgi:hypothetical protein